MRDPPSDRNAPHRIDRHDAPPLLVTLGRSGGRRGRVLLRPPIVKRAAAERRKARAEDHAGIDMIGARHHAIGESAIGLIQHRLDQGAAKTLELGLVVADLLALRLPLFPDIEALAGLLAELALLDQRRQHVVAAGRERKLLADLIGDVEPDHVHQLERPHRHAEFQRRLVDLLARLAQLVERGPPPSCTARARG